MAKPPWQQTSMLTKSTPPEPIRSTKPSSLGSCSPEASDTIPLSWSAPVRLVIGRRQGLLEPVGVVRRHLAGQPFDGFGPVAAVAHPPPGVRVEHEAEARSGRLPHPAQSFEVRFASGGRAHLVGREAQGLNRRRLLGVAVVRHVHAGRAVALDALSLPPAQQLRHRRAFKLGGQVDHGNLDGVVGLDDLGVPGEVEARPSRGIAALQEGSNDIADLSRGPFVGRPGRETHLSPLSAVTRMSIASRLRMVRSPPWKGSLIGSSNGQESSRPSTLAIFMAPDYLMRRPRPPAIQNPSRDALSSRAGGPRAEAVRLGWARGGRCAGCRESAVGSRASTRRPAIPGRLGAPPSSPDRSRPTERQPASRQQPSATNSARSQPASRRG